MAEKRGGKREGAGRRPNPVTKTLVRISVPMKYKKEVLLKFKKLVTAYENKCKREL